MVRTKKLTAKTEDHAEYTATPAADTEQDIIDRAIKILDSRIKNTNIISSPQALINYLRLKNDGLRIENFGVVFLNAKNHVIDDKIMQTGTIDQTAVYPREIAREALLNDAVAVILYHNHPSGDPAPSAHDRRLTDALRDTLKILSIRVHDHIIIGNFGYYSFAENGLI